MILDPRLTFKEDFNLIITKFLRASAALAALLCWKTSLNLNMKILLFTSCLRTIRTYGALTWTSVCATRHNILPNRVLWMIIAAPWFVSNVQIDQDLNIPTLTEDATVLASGTLERVARSKNPIIRHLEELNHDRPLPRVRTRRNLEADDWASVKTCHHSSDDSFRASGSPT